MAFTPFIRAAIFSAALFASSLPTVTQGNTNTAATPTSIERVGPTLSHPWGMEFLDHDTVLVTERGGRLLRIDLADGKATQITRVPRVYARRQGGLLDVAAIDGHIYLCYSALLDGGSATAIDRAVLDGNRLVKRQTIFTGNETSRSGHHFGCRMQLTGGMIYASLGDRGDRDNGQNPATNAASIIRINLDGSVPASNPHLPGWAPENFTIGHRNPQGMAMHPRTGAIWTHEHGPRGGDEINIIRPADYEGGRDGARIGANDGGASDGGARNGGATMAGLLLAMAANMLLGGGSASMTACRVMSIRCGFGTRPSRRRAWPSIRMSGAARITPPRVVQICSQKLQCSPNLRGICWWGR